MWTPVEVSVLAPLLQPTEEEEREVEGEEEDELAIFILTLPYISC